jgi:VIT1/CCC1 family predicted Fe2+/Mn2+ transporter
MSGTWKRWQDYATMAFGVLLFISPFVFGETSQRVASVSAYVLGVLLFLSWSPLSRPLSSDSPA